MKTSYSFPPSQRSSWCSALFLLLLAAVVVTPMAGGIVKAVPGGDVTLEVVSAWGGPVNTVDIQGNLAYIGSGRRMVILDITDFKNITEVGSIDLLSTVEDLAVRDGYAYVGTHHEIFGYGFISVDISDPGNPTLASNPDAFGNFQSRHVELYGNIACVNNGNSTRVFDITDPENVTDLGDIIILPHKAFTIKGDLLYTADKHPSTELAIYHLSKDPLNPELLGEFELDPVLMNLSAINVAVEGNLACLIIYDVNEQFYFLAVVDVSNPMSPELRGTYTLPIIGNGGGASNHQNSLAFSNGLAYVATGLPTATDGGLLIFDVATNPKNPTLISTFDTHASVYGVKKNLGTTVYLLDAGEGLIILDVSDPARPVRIGNYHSPAELRKMKKVGDLLYVSDAWNGLTILDVSDPNATPTVVGVYQTPDSHSSTTLRGNWGIDVRNGLAYLSEGRNGFEVVDVSDPENPVSAGAFKPWQDGVTAMTLKLNPLMELPFTDIAHIVTKPGGFLVNFDVSDPDNIQELGSVSTSSNTFAYDFEVTPDGRFAHLATAISVQALNVEDPLAPEVIHTQWGEDPRDIALDGDIRYIASGNLSGCDGVGSLRIQDISDPANPIDLSIVDWCYGDLGIRRVSAVAVSNDRAYVVALFSPPDTGAASTHVVVFDVTDPSAPVLLDWVKAGESWNSSLLFDDPYLYVTTYKDPITSEGLVIIEVVDEATTTIPDDFNAFRGFLASGTLDDVLAADDVDLCHDLGITIFPSEAPITLDFDGTLPTDSPTSLDVTFESSANTPGLELTISFWNYNTNSWDIVGTAAQGFNVDTVRTFNGVPADHVEAGTGAVRTRYEVRQAGIIFAFPWTDCIDHVFWTTTN